MTSFTKNTCYADLVQCKSTTAVILIYSALVPSLRAETIAHEADRSGVLISIPELPAVESSFVESSEEECGEEERAGRKERGKKAKRG